MSYQESVSVFVRAAIGITGTGLSILLENVSTVVSIVAGAATALFMLQQYLNARQKGKILDKETKKKNS